MTTRGNRNRELSNSLYEPAVMQDQTALFQHLDLGRVAILLDVDGTLLDIAPTPGGIHVPPSLIQTLTRLRHRTGGALALISGRTIGDLDHIFAPLKLFTIGGHGAELRVSAGSDGQGLRAMPLDDRLRERLINIAKVAPGILIEDKGYAIALHFRLATNLERALHKEVAAICAEFAPVGTIILRGKAVVEIKSGDFNKGATLRELMDNAPFTGRKPAFVGDDITDNDVFAALPEFGGIGFSVGHAIKGTAGTFDSPHDVRVWLGRLSGSREVQA